MQSLGANSCFQHPLKIKGSSCSTCATGMMVALVWARLVAEKTFDFGEQILVLNLFLDTADFIGRFCDASEVTVAKNSFSELRGDFRGAVPFKFKVSVILAGLLNWFRCSMVEDLGRLALRVPKFS